MRSLSVASNSGSRWHRWDPHIHAPGTVMNDQLNGADHASEYIRRLNETAPRVRAIGVTDYYVLDTYEAICSRRDELPDCALIFPSIELRVGLQTVKGRFVNLHLIVSPEDAKHVEHTKRFLEQLTFEAHGDTYRCRRDELIRLGRKANPTKTAELAALAHGALQFKVDFGQLRTAYGKSDWAKAHILIAVSGTETDGTSGMRDRSDQTLREEMEHFADIIFASSEAQRDFWLGSKAASLDELKERYRGAKPCLHGCDAHNLSTIGAPDGDCYSWVKGDIRFDALRQACIDPAGRALGSDASNRAESRTGDDHWSQGIRQDGPCGHHRRGVRRASRNPQSVVLPCQGAEPKRPNRIADQSSARGYGPHPLG